jgi:hypothetical protein
VKECLTINIFSFFDASDTKLRAVRQKFFTDEKFHLTILQLMDLECPLLMEQPKLRAELLRVSHRMLQMLLVSNRPVQNEIAPSVSLLLDHNTIVDNVPATLRALYEGNKDMCLEVPESLLTTMMHMMHNNTE